MVTITLYRRQQKRHRCIEQSFGHCGRGRGWDDLGEWHWNIYNIIYETSCQSRLNGRYWMLGAGALGWPRGMVRGGRKEEGSGWGTRVYLWRIRVDIWQNQYNIVKLKNKIKKKKKDGVAVLISDKADFKVKKYQSQTGTLYNVSVQFSSVAQSCLTLCNPMNCSTPGFPVHHQLPESTQPHVHWVSDAIQSSHPLSSPSPPALNLSQHQGLFQSVGSSRQGAKVLESQLQH